MSKFCGHRCGLDVPVAFGTRGEMTVGVDVGRVVGCKGRKDGQYWTKEEELQGGDVRRNEAREW